MAHFHTTKELIPVDKRRQKSVSRISLSCLSHHVLEERTRDSRPFKRRRRLRRRSRSSCLVSRVSRTLQRRTA